MRDERQQANINREFRPVKGFEGIQVRYLRFPHDVLDKAECDHCQYIPKEVYYLRCFKHKLCPECKHYYNAYYCNKCGVQTSTKELSDAVRCINDEAEHLRVLCPFCEEEMRLELMEDHYQECLEKPIVCIFCKSKMLNKEKTKHNLQCPWRLVRCKNCKTFYAYSLEKKHKSECPKTERKGSDGDVNVLNESLQNNQDMECQEQLVFCDTCTSIMIYEDLGMHKYQCPMMERECSDCGVNVLNRNRQIHLDFLCRKRLVSCFACDSTVCHDEWNDHRQECPGDLVFCDDCSDEVLRKEKSKHASECPMRVVYCGNCEGFYAYSLEKEHKEQCEIKKLACEYCKLELKGDDEDHYQECLEKPIVCIFCKSEMLNKEKTKHNLQCPWRLVRCENCKTFYAYSLEKKHKSECPKTEGKGSDGDVNVLNEGLQNNQDMECQEQLVSCDTCTGIMIYEDLGTHKYQCPLMERECSVCGVNVLNRDRQTHLDLECEKRVVFCGACDSTMCYDERDDHDQECPEKLVYCDDCSDKVLRKEKFKHASECPMRVVYCGNCEGFYAYSSEKEHKEQCEIKKLACEYCTLELKGDDEKNAHLETCEDALIECPFKEFGCSEKAPRKKNAGT